MADTQLSYVAPDGTRSIEEASQLIGRLLFPVGDASITLIQALQDRPTQEDVAQALADLSTSGIDLTPIRDAIASANAQAQAALSRATKEGIGLGNADNTSDTTKASPGNPIGDAIAQALRPSAPGFNAVFSAAFAAWMASLPTASANPDDPAPVAAGKPYKLGPGGPVVIAQ